MRANNEVVINPKPSFNSVSVITWRCGFPSQAESDEYHTRLVEQSEQLHKAEERSEERGLQVDELQRLLGSMEIESGALKDKMAAGEAELLQLKASREEGAEEQRRWDGEGGGEPGYNHFE